MSAFGRALRLNSPAKTRPKGKRQWHGRSCSSRKNLQRIERPEGRGLDVVFAKYGRAVYDDASGRMVARLDFAFDCLNIRMPDRKRKEKDRKSTRLNSSHSQISYAVFCLKKKKKK